MVRNDYVFLILRYKIQIYKIKGKAVMKFKLTESNNEILKKLIPSIVILLLCSVWFYQLMQAASDSPWGLGLAMPIAVTLFVAIVVFAGIILSCIISLVINYSKAKKTK